MGNTTVTPAAVVMSSTPFRVPTKSPTHSIALKSPVSTFVTNFDASVPPEKSPTPSISVNPVISTSVTNFDNSPSPIPTISANSIDSTSSTNLNHTTVAIKSPVPPIASNSLTSMIPVISTIVDIPASPTIRVTSPIFATPTVSTPVIPVTSTADNIFVKSSRSTSVISPDSTAVSPTFDIPPTPVPTAAINSINSITSLTDTHSASTAIPVKPTGHIISRTPPSTKVSLKRTTSRISITSPTRTTEQTKSTNLSSVELKQKQREKHIGYFHTAQQAHSLNTSISPPPTDTNDDRKKKFLSPNIIPVPSFSLRSTAVCNSSQDNYILSERTPSIHKDISIFKYYLTQKETTKSIGNHTKATMFKMNTHLKQTPLPTPSLSFLTKNFNDGTHEIDHNSMTTPTFGSLGLQNDLFVSSTVISQSNLSSAENKSVQNNRPPLVSILKKRTSQAINKPVPTQTDNKVFQGLQKNNIENSSSTVSFNIPSPKKTNQSISRSVKLFSEHI